MPNAGRSAAEHRRLRQAEELERHDSVAARETMHLHHGTAAPRPDRSPLQQLLDHEGDAQVDPPFGDIAIRAGHDLDLVDPSALDVLDGSGGLLESRTHGVLDADIR